MNNLAKHFHLEYNHFKTDYIWYIYCFVPYLSKPYEYYWIFSYYE